MPIEVACATDFGAQGLQSQSWFDDVKAAGFEGFITTLHTNWGGVKSPWPDGITALERAQTAGLWIAAYGRPVSHWFEALNPVPTALRNALLFYALDVESEDDGPFPLQHEYFDGVFNTFNVRPVAYTTPGEWEAIHGTVDDQFRYMHLWEFAGNIGPPGSLSEYPIWEYSGWNKNAPAIWTTGGFDPGDTVPNVQNRRVAQQSDITGETFQGVTIIREYFLTQWLHRSVLPPSNIVLDKVSDTQIDLSWNAVGSASGYDILRNNVLIVENHQTTSYEDTGLDPNTTYRYRLRTRYPE